MIVNIYNKNDILCTVDIEFAPNCVFIEKIISINKNWEYAEKFLSEDGKYYLAMMIEDRCPYICSREYDEYAFNILEISDDKRHWFGRMCDYRVAVGLMNHFRTEDDDISIYPVKHEMVTFISYDVALYKLYIWYPKEE